MNIVIIADPISNRGFQPKRSINTIEINPATKLTEVVRIATLFPSYMLPGSVLF